MTAQTIMSDALPELGIDQASPSVTSTDFADKQILNFMNKAGQEIAKRAEWASLFKDLTVSGSISAVDLPTDFQRMAESGAVRLNDGTFTPIRAVTSPEQWEMLTATPSAQYFYHITEGEIQFSPALPAGGALVRYISKNWVSGDKSAITADADTTLIPERLIVMGLIWRFKRQKGLPYEDYFAEFEAELETSIRDNRGAT